MPFPHTARVGKWHGWGIFIRKWAHIMENGPFPQRELHTPEVSTPLNKTMLEKICAH